MLPAGARKGKVIIMPTTTFSPIEDGDIIFADHVIQLREAVQNLERGASFYAETSTGSIRSGGRYYLLRVVI